ncbi:HATPase_c domain-containing protein [Blastomyces dermatitidis ATCC 18188]|uniref:HATPase_c domain-containing protein n=1 Tax=Ajellomyces dermatitidis (strain ATCC 18188 / CBS 674.68) TaxID=653446 RepID=F2TK88_AJEDA|nr:HATPase_c domain-containing protein [Blastomyces dermatitidis ATCC 18188]
MSTIDFNALKARTLGSGNDEEAVTVNTRALIDKVLARYSGEWTVLRELLQNAADACASNVTIKFETLPSTSVPAPTEPDPSASLKHVISHHTLKRLILTNNGTPFSPNDWARLKRIAEGNPDETKIGAFGVGFYSVFSDCEEPFVSSGSEAIAFYWKENALFTRRLKLGEADSSPNTNFVLDYRNTTSPVPALMPLCQFLASALTFVGLESVELWLDGWKLAHLAKKVAPSVNIEIPRDVQTKTNEELMTVSSVLQEVAQMNATWMEAVSWKTPSNASRFDSSRHHDPTVSLKSFFSRLTGSSSTNNSTKTANPDKASKNEAKENLLATKTSSVLFHISTGTIKTSVVPSFARELERATKKPPPKTTTLAVLTASYDLRKPGQNNNPRDTDIFASVLPSKSGRIFIGFPTHQTTGLNAHISAPSVIPTVERESIDLNARWVRTWNVELLRAAGIVCRIAFSAEMSSLNSRIQAGVSPLGRSKIRKDDIALLLPEAVHTFNQFVFRESTPTSQVGQVIEDSFWTCSKNAMIEVLSTCGILPCHQVRVAPKDLSFMDSIPVIPDELMAGAKDFVKRLTDFGLVTDITVSDIIKELESSPLTPKQLEEFLLWVTKKASSREIDLSTVRSLLRVAVANDEPLDATTSRVIVLSDVNSFLNPNKIPVELPMPPSVMPFKYTKNLPKYHLEALGWNELQVSTWITWLVENAKNRDLLRSDQDITQIASFAAQVLPVLSRQWDSLGVATQGTLVGLLRNITIIPTKSGMKRPPETYFPSVRLFDDLPVVTGLNNVKEKFLGALGVRKTVELNVIFERLLNNDDVPTDRTPARKKWSHVDLIKYLTSVRDDIPPEDIQKLKEARICTAVTNGNANMDGIRYKVSELYAPDESVRALELPILYWPGRYSPSSSEGRFLTLLGLKSFPSAKEVLQLMAWAASADNAKLRDKAMTYYITNHISNGYVNFEASTVNMPFLPVEGQTKLSTPKHCFTDDGATLFGFDLLKRELHPHASKFGVSQHPSLSGCIDILVGKPPSSKKEARILFEYFAKRLGEINSPRAERLGQARIVPVTRKTSNSSSFFPNEKSSPVTYIAPRDCYLGESDDYGDIFDFVDFGQEANLFLLACGSKREPTKAEVASMLVKEPARVSAKLQSPDKYLNLLRSVAESIHLLKKNRDLFRDMKTAPFLLASKELPSKPTASRKPNEQLIDVDDETYEDEAQGIKEWQLVKARDAIIVDDYASFSLFKQNILAAPQEELLEDMYVALGTPCLSELVEEQPRCGALAPDQRIAVKLQKQIYERSRLFLHDLPREMIKHDTKWLEKNLSVQVVQSISLRRSLKGRHASHVEQRSAAVMQTRAGWVLSIAAGRADLYQVSQALVHLILNRPKLHSTLTLEMLLKTDLLELRARGYNVERILRQKAAEARMAETKRQQQLEAELKQIQESEVAWRKHQQSEQQQDQHKQQSMPGDFPSSSPPHDRKSSHDAASSEATSSRPKSGRGLFSDLTRRFGLEDLSRSNNPVQSALQGFRDRAQRPTSSSDAPPPPYSTNETGSTRHPNPQNVTSPHTLQSNLMSAIQACRPHGSSTLYSRGEQNKVMETKSYCDERPSHDLLFAADSASGIRIFVTKTVDNCSTFLTANSDGLNAFASILVDCASVFSLRLDSVSIFYDPAGRTIAFNSRGSIFCNYLYFQQLHQSRMLDGGPESREEALVYWWVIFCHELAHNLVADHSSDHSFYTEGFVAQYFAKVTRKIAEYMATPTVAAASPGLSSPAAPAKR